MQYWSRWEGEDVCILIRLQHEQAVFQVQALATPGSQPRDRGPLETASDLGLVITVLALSWTRFSKDLLL
jgi:hypothetical protein